MEALKIDRVRTGAMTGLIVVIVTTLINVISRYVGWLPPAMDLSHMAEVFVDPALNPSGALTLGIVIHIIGGVTVGIGYVYFIKSLGPGTGLLFMLAFWLIMMMVGMPLTGRGWFGLNEGSVLPIATFVLNCIFGTAMGIVARKRLMVER